jgi:hypothetical protein
VSSTSQEFRGAADPQAKRASLPFGLSALFSHFSPRPARTSRKAMMVPVWDAHRNQYRSVDLRNREDPLWQQAKTLAAVQSRGERAKRSAA